MGKLEVMGLTVGEFTKLAPKRKGALVKSLTAEQWNELLRSRVENEGNVGDCVEEEGGKGGCTFNTRTAAVLTSSVI